MVGGNRGASHRDLRRAFAGAALAAASAAASAQSGDSGATPLPPPSTQPAPAPSATPAPSEPARLDPVEIRGTRPDDVQERRQSTAAKIVIGRDEIDRFGDATLGDVLKRLPGITIQGRPGRGGAIRMRGLGNGYTQILLDGERIPPGFSLDSLTPDQIERIEILRAPTAETGARAIAGTINIVTRGGYTRRVNDIKLTAGYENGNLQPQASWTRNIVAGPFIVNYSLTAFANHQDVSSTETRSDERLSDGVVVRRQREEDRADSRRHGINATGRLEWRGGAGGGAGGSAGPVDQLTLTPVVIVSRSRSDSDTRLTQSLGATPLFYDSSHTDGENDFSLLRLNGQWVHRIALGRIEWRAGIGRTSIDGESLRTERTGGATSRTLQNALHIRDTSLTAGGKLTRNVFDDHLLVAGLEAESNRRRDARRTLQDGQPVLTEFGDRLSASSVRLAAYAQDEWNLTSQWAAHAGLRWEGIATEGSGALGDPGGSEPKNRSSVWTPLLHAVWKPDPAARDQVRISLTRSYRSPTLQQLIGRPRINTRYPVPGANTPTEPDYAGNPELKPELATGIDLAFERYLPGSGVLSANLFRRNITNYLRSVTLLENVPYSTTPRYVIRPRNVGDAVTQGIELEAKFRLSDLIGGAPRVDVRANASFFDSKVKDVPGPNNRLDQQPDYTANAGADYRFAAAPLMVGGNLNFTPAYSTRISAQQRAYLGRKLIADVYALWTFNPALALRLSLSNLDPHDYRFGSTVDGPDLQGQPVRESEQTVQPTSINVQLRLEMKL